MNTGYRSKVVITESVFGSGPERWMVVVFDGNFALQVLWALIAISRQERGR